MKLAAIAAAAVFSIATTPVTAKTFTEMFPDHPGYVEEDLNTLLNQLDYKQGDYLLPGGLATYTVPDGYYLLDASDGRRVLEELWGNPPSEDTLGMLFPVGYLPVDAGSWGVEVTWEEIGYVSDEDADTIDYDDLLAEMKRDVAEESRWRVQNGYEAIELVGWAAEPFYDQEARKLHWAKELHFGEVETNTLNYSIRALGRRGVLQMNFIAGMEALPEVEAAVPDFMSMVAFNDGHRYADFDPSIDTVAAVGIGGLIAGKVLTKTGLLAVALVFLKKFWFLALIPFMALGRLFRRG